MLCFFKKRGKEVLVNLRGYFFFLFQGFKDCIMMLPTYCLHYDGDQIIGFYKKKQKKGKPKRTLLVRFVVHILFLLLVNHVGKSKVKEVI